MPTSNVIAEVSLALSSGTLASYGVSTGSHVRSLRLEFPKFF
jgi:hypothetical protein